MKRTCGHKAIDLPFEVASLKHLLACAASPLAYSHEQIADWAHRFWWHCAQPEEAATQGFDSEMIQAAAIVEDVDAQWELLLVNTYSVEQLQELDFSIVKMPDEWFRKWQSELG